MSKTILMKCETTLMVKIVLALIVGLLLLAGCGQEEKDNKPNIENKVPRYIQTYTVDVPNTQIRYRCVDTSSWNGGLWCERISK